MDDTTYLHTNVLGVYVRPQDIDGRLIILAGDRNPLQKVYDSKWDHSQKKTYSYPLQGGKSVPGCTIVAKERDKTKAIHIIWKPNTNRLGASHSYYPLTKAEIDDKIASFEDFPGQPSNESSTAQDGNQHEESEDESDDENEAPVEALLPRIGPQGGEHIVLKHILAV